MTRARGWAWRAMLSALAGSGLTVAGLGGPLAGGALAADASVRCLVARRRHDRAGHHHPGAVHPRDGRRRNGGSAGEHVGDHDPRAEHRTADDHAARHHPGGGAARRGSPDRGRAAPAENDSEQEHEQQQQQPHDHGHANPADDRQPAGGAGAQGPTTASGPNGVAPSPQVVAAQAGALAAELATSAASVQALGFYRIPLFLLPIYQAAAIQYGVPWQILAAINEVETDYGSDLSVSSAGAEGWMQFEPSTWLQYGVDALDAGYADPYNPVDAIFAAARYLHAAGASKNLRTAILAYNHSEAYAESVLLRAKLISSYPKSVIATLTGLVDARLPVTGKQVAWGALLPAPAARPSSATANAKAVAGAAKTGSSAAAATDSAAQAGTSGSTAAGSTPGSVPAPAPAVAADAASGTAAATGTAGTADAAPQFVELLSAPNASVVAVQDGRVLGLGRSHRLGKYVILRDIYGDVFTYAGLGSIAPSYRLPKVPSAALVAAAKSQAAPPARPAAGERQRR